MLKGIIFLGLFLSVFTFSKNQKQKDYSQWVTQCRSIEKDPSGNFKLTFERTAYNNKDQRIILTDNDGVATLAIAQIMLVDKIRDLKKISMNSSISNIFKSGEAHILTIQREALDKLIHSLLEVVKNGQGQSKLEGSDELTVAQALTLAQELRRRFSIKTQWTILDIENMGKAIQKIAKTGGPYTATYTQGKYTQNFYDIRLNNIKDPSESFLSGAVTKGFFLPSHWITGNGEFSKSHIWIVGDMGKIGRKYISTNYKPDIIKGSH